MKLYEKNFEENEDGFSGNYLAYKVRTSEDNLKIFLENNIENAHLIYEIIQQNIDEIVIIKNINIDEEFQGQGYGTQLLREILTLSHAPNAILLCDISETQKENFVLESFYEKHDFKTILMSGEYPLMVYPSVKAHEIIDNIYQLNHKKNKLSI